MQTYARFCGLPITRAQDKGGEAAHIAVHLGGTDRLDDVIDDYAVEYTDHVERAYEPFVEAMRSGQLNGDLSTIE
jgi:hypothetical protein